MPLKSMHQDLVSNEIKAVAEDAELLSNHFWGPTTFSWWGIQGRGPSNPNSLSQGGRKCKQIFWRGQLGKKSMTPRVGKHYSLWFPPRLRLEPLKGFLSWHGALQGPSTCLVRRIRHNKNFWEGRAPLDPPFRLPCFERISSLNLLSSPPPLIP